ncbi:YihY/virulence factor BrkB family protein [Marisediminicola antarctica]|uniref:Ribonuclease BN n=1 Tax=Marisediminicola antarctica TaxID=674079 RepID=A0A7L5AI79_9MICO|nr:YihY/virulence factor BrkB family protein [Marisediminicola antarctica]QHO69776.1 ribonuclease BN [Marisediminicola antarctica]
MASDITRETPTDRPAPDDPRKPDSPDDIAKPSWKYVVGKTLREFTSDGCIDIAAALTYFAVLALFPALIALVSLLGVIGQGGAMASLLDVFAEIAPESVVEVIRGPLEDFASSPAAGFALVSGILVAIWAASGYVSAFSRAMNRVYEIEEGRPVWKLKPLQLLVTLIGIALMLVIAVILAVSGPVAEVVGSALGIGGTTRFVWSILKWPVLLAIVVVMVAILYYATPNAKQPKLRWMSMGAFIALLMLTIASLLFGVYVSNFSNYDRTFGSLAGVVVFLLWLWIANLALLFGAEFNAELERSRQLQAGIAAEETIQLPPRSVSKSKKTRTKELQDIETGRRLRERADRIREKTPGS